MLLGATIALLGACALIYTVLQLRHAAASEHWPSAEGRILTSSVQTLHRVKHGPVYEPDVKYEYRVGDTALRANRVQFVQRSYPWEDQAQEIVDRYPVGATVTVRYDPQHPKRAVLEPGRPRGNLPFVTLAAELFITILGISLAFVEITPSRASGGRGSWVLDNGMWGWLVIGAMIVCAAGIGIWIYRRKGHYNALVPSGIFGAVIILGMVVLNLANGRSLDPGKLLMMVAICAVATFAIYLRFRADSRA
jgi:hypothetical protein